MLCVDSGYTISTNSALGRPVFQSSDYIDYFASRAVDGNKASMLTLYNSCSHTADERDPWWAVELEGSLDVVRVDIINRGDCCRELAF